MGRISRPPRAGHPCATYLFRPRDFLSRECRICRPALFGFRITVYYVNSSPGWSHALPRSWSNPIGAFFVPTIGRRRPTSAGRRVALKPPARLADRYIMRSPSAPRRVYASELPDMLAEMGRAGAAAFLGVSLATIDRWRREPDRAPRAVLWAMAYETSRGRQALFVDHFNELRLLYARFYAAERQIEQLRDELARLAPLAAAGAANDATWSSYTRPSPRRSPERPAGSRAAAAHAAPAPPR